jgi:outer membrane lipoprotein carrier protein
VRALVLAALLGASLAARAGGLDDFLAFSATTKSATARFEQQVVDRSGRTVDRASGTLAFARPGKFRWTYEKPAKSLLVGDGTRLWLYDQDLNQVTVKAYDRSISSTPAALLAGKEDIASVFTLRDAGEENGLAWVAATPKEKDTGFESAKIGMKGRTLAAMELVDQLGGRTMITFADFKSNPALPPETFRFTPPKGTDVLDEAAPRKR